MRHFDLKVKSKRQKIYVILLISKLGEISLLNLHFQPWVTIQLPPKYIRLQTKSGRNHSNISSKFCRRDYIQCRSSKYQQELLDHIYLLPHLHSSRLHMDSPYRNMIVLRHIHLQYSRHHKHNTFRSRRKDLYPNYQKTWFYIVHSIWIVV